MIIDRESVLALWNKAAIRPECVAELNGCVANALSYKAEFYEPIQTALGIPWYVIAAIDMREESFRHHNYLGNGQPLDQVTTIVPKGRGPFASWSDGAIDALTLRGFNRLPVGIPWNIVTALDKVDAWNGLGYDHMGIPSPYVWSLTNIQQSGKFTADGVFDASIMDTQPGCAALFLALKAAGVALDES